MKKLLLVLVVMALLASIAYAESEINFCGISWLENETNTINTLVKKGFIREGMTGIMFTDDNPTYPLVDETGFVSPDYVTGLEDVSFQIKLDKLAKGRIAGYPVKNISLSFAYDGEYHLIAAEVEFINATYEELLGKIASVYGDPAVNGTEEGITSNVWTGDNQSAIILYTQSEGLSFTLMYGRLDAKEILQNCLNYSSDDVSGL